MAVNWNWKSKIGQMTIAQENGKVNINIYQGNCLAVLIFDYKESGKEMYSFQGFWNDKQHLKRCLGVAKTSEENIYANVVKLKLNTAYRETAEIVDCFMKAKMKLNIELYYKK